MTEAYIAFAKRVGVTRIRIAHVVAVPLSLTLPRKGGGNPSICAFLTEACSIALQPAQPIGSDAPSSSSTATAAARRVSTARWLM